MTPERAKVIRAAWHEHMGQWGSYGKQLTVVEPLQAPLIIEKFDAEPPIPMEFKTLTFTLQRTGEIECEGVVVARDRRF